MNVIISHFNEKPLLEKTPLQNLKTKQHLVDLILQYTLCP